MREPRCVAFLFCLCISHQLSQVSSLEVSTLRWRAPRIKFEGLFHSYPVGFWRKLTSSVPRREYSLENVSICFDSSSFWILQGASSSGKSTILKIIQGQEVPISGSFQIIYDDTDDNKANVKAAVPILLDERPFYDNNQQTVRSIWSKALKSGKLAGTEDFSSMLLDDMENIFELPMDKTARSLSPSELYRCRLAEAAIHSVYPSFEDNCLSAPILMLDEWMDKETSEVIRKVQYSIQRMIQEKGAVVVSVTHKPNLYNLNRESSNSRQITLSRGKILFME